VIEVLVGGAEVVGEHRADLERIGREGLRADLDLAAEIARPFVRLAVAAEGETRRGLLVGWAVADELHVLDVVVAREARRRGVGRALVVAALDDARARGARIALLEVRRTNRAAIKLYLGAGFVAVRVRKGYYEDTDEDAVEMAAELAPGALAEFERVPIDLLGP
jgi:ribosomal protein S18 acetylase RimI-like enzyme